MLAVGSKPGGPFKRVAKGTYTLADPSPTETPGACGGGRRRAAGIGRASATAAPDENEREQDELN